MIRTHHILQYLLLLVFLPIASPAYSRYQIQTTSKDTIPQHEDVLRLGKALDYFMSSKYHEALLILQQLDNHYHLNPRYLAYLGICYYYEWDYKNALKYLNKAIPQLENFSPHEQSLYFYDAAESYFYLGKYQNAIPLYLKMLSLCYNNEKPDALYRIGFCYMFAKNWMNARDYFVMALKEYKKYRNTPDMKARMTQISNMINGCLQHLPERFYQWPAFNYLIKDEKINTIQAGTLNIVPNQNIR